MSEYTPKYDLHVALSRLLRDFSESTAEWIAEEAIRRLSAADRKTLLIGYVAAEVTNRRRDEARRVEQRAYRESTREDRNWRKKHQQDKDRLQVEDPLAYRRRYPTLAQAIEDFRAEVKLELTVELLASSFALGDGRRVLWGQATVADHRQRVGLLAGQAAGTLRTAALHEEAIALIEATGSTCLSEAKRRQQVAA